MIELRNAILMLRLVLVLGIKTRCLACDTLEMRLFDKSIPSLGEAYAPKNHLENLKDIPSQQS